MTDGIGSPPSAELAAAVLDRLSGLGVSDVVLAPGSRSAPLAFALWEAEKVGRFRLHVRIDERSAGFLALGLTKVGARAAVVTTSGTAVANLHPAVLEALHAGLGLVVVSADRPARLRATGANQTTRQVGIFGADVPTLDLVSVAEIEAVADTAGRPLHLNVQFDVPLVAGPASYLANASSSASTTHADARYDGANPHPLPRGPRTVVVAGDDAGPPARVLAERAGWPLVAEPTSGARTGTHALRTGRLLVGTDLGARVERVVVFGRPTLARPITALLQRPDVEVLVVPAAGFWPPAPPGSRAIGAPSWEGSWEGSPDDPDWLAAWQEADRDLGRRIDAEIARFGADSMLTPYDVATATWQALPAGGLFVVGASSPIRDLDLVARPAKVGERRKVIANRGLAGIDGTLSTAIGAALGRPRTSRALALVGDLTFLHDQNGLVIGPDERRPDLTIVVPNDDGGAIFSTLEQGAPEHAESFERIFGTPHGVDLAQSCAAVRVPHLRVDSRLELEHALASPNGGIEVIEARIDRSTRRDLDARLRALAAT